MPIQCRLVERPKNTDDLDVGDMYFIDDTRPDLSDFYYANNKNRKPLMICLPGRVFFCVDSKCYGPMPNDPNTHGYYGGWTVTGEPPNITVHPSINVVGRYHGFITNGMIGDPI